MIAKKATRGAKMGKYREIKEDFGEAYAEVFDPKKTKKQKLSSAYKWFYKLRSILLAIPVVFFAVVLALRNLATLPAKVGFDLQASGAFAYTVDKSVAVMGPLAVTAVCLLLMFISKKVTYPWLISLFSLVLPMVIYLVNTFPG